MKVDVLPLVVFGVAGLLVAALVVVVLQMPSEDERRAAAYEWLRRHGRSADSVSCRPHGPLCDVLPPAPGNPYVLLCGRSGCRLEVER